MRLEEISIVNNKEPSVATKSALILQNAARLFAVKGFSETTADDIAKACGVSKGFLYNYFTSKNELREAIARALLDDHIQMKEKMERMTRNIQDEQIIPVLSEIFDLCCHHFSDRPRYTIVTRNEMSRLDRGLRRQFVEVGNHSINILEQIISRGVNAGIFAVEHPRMAAVTIFWITQEWVNRWIYLRDYYNLEEYIEIQTKNILQMLNTTHAKLVLEKT